MTALGQDLVYALRSLRSTPACTAAVVLTLALGIGANSAIFSVVDAVLLRPLPFPDAARVMNVAWDGGDHFQALSAAKFEYWRDHARALDAMATWRLDLGRAEIDGAVVAVNALGVTRDFFDVVGYGPALGRGFSAADHVSGTAGVAIVSHAIWRTHFAGAADVLGRTIRLNGEPLSIVGVLPESFAFPYDDAPVELIVPITLTVDPADIAENSPTIARLREGVTREEAQSAVAALNAPFQAAYPGQVSARDRGMTLATFGELYVNATVRRALWMLMGAVTLVLLIACANAANLFLARAAERRAEIAIRAALGAGGARIARLVLAESALAALAAGALGLMVGWWIAGALVALSPVDVPRMAAIGIDWRVAAFTFAVSLATSVLFGGVAAWPAARMRIAQVLGERSRGSSGRSRVRHGLIAVQSGLSLMLLVGAGLLVATLIALTQVDPGFDADGLVAVRVPSRPPGYETSQRLWDFEQRVVQQLAGSPVIASIAGASSLPLERGVNTPMTITGRPDASGTVEWRAVTPGYFETLGIPLLAGRTFDGTDLAGRPPVAIVNDAFARTYFGDESPIGQRVDVGRGVDGKWIDQSLAGQAVEIVGVVAGIREMSLRAEPRRTMYVPQAQAPTLLSAVRGTMPVLIAKGRVAGREVQRVLAQAVQAADPALPRPEVFPVDDLVARSLARERFGAALASVLAALALALTAFGIYAALAYTIQQRRREIGIRMALGANRLRVTRQVMAQGIAPVLVGIVVGVLGAIALSRVAAGFLWGVSPTDAATLATTVALLLGVALAASSIPAWAAARLDPARTINRE